MFYLKQILGYKSFVMRHPFWPTLYNLGTFYTEKLKNKRFRLSNIYNQIVFIFYLKTDLKSIENKNILVKKMRNLVISPKNVGIQDTATES